MYFILSSLIGVLLAVMIYLNGGLASQLGNYGASSFVHLTGLMLVTLLLLFKKPTLPQKAISPLLLSGGMFGFLTVVCANMGVVHLGVTLTLALGLLGETVSALVIDHAGWLGRPVIRFERRTIGSVVLIVLGITVLAYF